MISRPKSQFYIAILRPQALLRHTNVAQERNQKRCLLYEIDGNVWLHGEGKVLETWLLKKVRIDASKNRGLELACLENPVWENETPKCLGRTEIMKELIWWSNVVRGPERRTEQVGENIGYRHTKRLVAKRN